MELPAVSGSKLPAVRHPRGKGRAELVWGTQTGAKTGPVREAEMVADSAAESSTSS